MKVPHCEINRGIFYSIQKNWLTWQRLGYIIGTLQTWTWMEGKTWRFQLHVGLQYKWDSKFHSVYYVAKKSKCSSGHDTLALWKYFGHTVDNGYFVKHPCMECEMWWSYVCHYHYSLTYVKCYCNNILDIKQVKKVSPVFCVWVTGETATKELKTSYIII